MAALDIAIYKTTGRHRSRTVAEAMLQGILAVEGKKRIEIIDETKYSGPVAPIAVFYGLHGHLQQAFDTYRSDPSLTVVYVDLGYWTRRFPGERFSGYHKISVNARHPTEYFQNVKHGPVRRRERGIEIAPWQSAGEHILLAGMGDKAAKAEGYQYEEWERAAIQRIRAVSARDIVYRPKPSDGDARPIPGTIFNPSKGDSIDKIFGRLQGCHAVVTHHSNVAVDALVAGVPAFCDEGVARPLACGDLSQIETPFYPTIEMREQWANDLAWIQWSIAEMATGAAWRYLRDENLLK